MMTQLLRPTILRRWLLLPALLALVLSLEQPAVYAANITVDTNDPNIADDGNCSLIEAIINANDDKLTHPNCLVAGNGADTITFGPGIKTIVLCGEVGQEQNLQNDRISHPRLN